MGNGQSAQAQSRATAPHPHDYNGPYFGGHYPGDFSLRRPDTNKALPPTPKSVRFGTSPPAWEFYRYAPPCDNTKNTRYCSARDVPRADPPPPMYPSRSATY